MGEYIHACGGDETDLEKLFDKIALEGIINYLSASLPLDVLEKQSLLEAPDPLARCELLLRLIEFRRAESELPEGPKSVN